MSVQTQRDFNGRTVSIVRPNAISVSDRLKWAQIQEQNIELQNPFLTWEFANAAASFRKDLQVMVISKNGQGEAFLPMNLQGRYARPAAAPLCDYQMVIADKGFNLNLKDVMQAGKVNVFSFNGLIDPEHQEFPCATEELTRYIADFSDGFEAYKTALPKKGRQSLKRTLSRRQKAEDEFGSLRVEHNSASPDDIKQLFKWKTAQYSQSGKYDILSQKWVSDFLLYIASLKGDKFAGFVSKLYFGDKLVAVNLNLRHGVYAQGWIIGYDADYRDYSPGLILFEDIFRNHKELGIERFDFSTGDAQYKRHLSNRICIACAGFERTSGLRALLHKGYNKIEEVNQSVLTGKHSNVTTRVRRRYQQITACDPTWSGRLKTFTDTGLGGLKEKVLAR